MLHYNRPRCVNDKYGRPAVINRDIPEQDREIAIRHTNTEYIRAVVYVDGVTDVYYERRLVSESPRTVEVIQRHNVDKYGRYFETRSVYTGPDAVV